LETPILRRERPASSPSWWTDAGIALGLLFLFFLLRPLVPDGDGLTYAHRALGGDPFSGLTTKHFLYPVLLRGLAVAIQALALRPFALDGFVLLSCLNGAIIYLLLVRLVFPPFLRDARLVRLCALGTLFSYGVLAACCTIEVYSLALALDLGLVAVCLHADLARWPGAIAAALLFGLAVSVHITNVLLFPFVGVVLMIHARRRGHGQGLLAFAATSLMGALIVGAVIIGCGPGGFAAPDWGQLLPHSEAQPHLTLAGRFGRGFYGMARTLTWLVPLRAIQQDRSFLSPLGAFLTLLLLLLLTLAVARQGFRQRLGGYRRLWLGMALIAVPFIGMGFYYFPSDPERWLFLMPAFWLIVGLVWAEQDATAVAWPGVRGSRLLLAGLLLILAGHNGLTKMWPDARHNRELAGLRELPPLADSGALVIVSNTSRETIEELLLREPIHFESLPLDVLMSKHGRDVQACQEELRRRVQQALRQGRQVYAFQLLDEGLEPGRGYPWASVQANGYAPATLLSVLEEFRPVAVVKPDRFRAGTYQLRGERDRYWAQARPAGVRE
jgi:hypothetical protein